MPASRGESIRGGVFRESGGVAGVLLKAKGRSTVGHACRLVGRSEVEGRTAFKSPIAGRTLDVDGLRDAVDEAMPVIHRRAQEESRARLFQGGISITIFSLPFSLYRHEARLLLTTITLSISVGDATSGVVCERAIVGERSGRAEGLRGEI